jgi:hypothetical protein
LRDLVARTHIMGEDLIIHLGLDYYSEWHSPVDTRQTENPK